MRKKDEPFLPEEFLEENQRTFQFVKITNKQGMFRFRGGDCTREHDYLERGRIVDGFELIDMTCHFATFEKNGKYLKLPKGEIVKIINLQVRRNDSTEASKELSRRRVSFELKYISPSDKGIWIERKNHKKDSSEILKLNVDDEMTKLTDDPNIFIHEILKDRVILRIMNQKFMMEFKKKYFLSDFKSEEKHPF